MKIVGRIIVTLYCLVSYAWALAGIAVEISPTSVKLGETFRLTLTMDVIQNHATPDWQPLLKEFDILGTERNVSYTVINGQARAISQWGILLKPKKIGTLIIPAIHIGQAQSLPSQIVVDKNIQSSQAIAVDDAPTNESVFLASTDNDHPLIHQQITYTIRLLTQQRLLDAQYHPPHVEDALFIPLGDGRHYQTQFKGQLYEVEEQQYALFAQKSGPLIIEPPSLDALAYGEIGPSRIRLKAKTIKIDVAPLPEKQSMNNWLPASAVELSESYDAIEKKALEGDTLTRTITLKAQGITAQLLPTITFQNTAQYRVYAEKPTTENQIKAGALWGSLNTQVTYLLSQAGQVVLPPINIPWYNTTTHRYEMASLPSKTITVNARPDRSSHASKKETARTINTSKKYITKASTNALTITFIVILLTLIIGGYFLWQKNLVTIHINSRRKISKKEASSTPETSLSLKNACKKNDPQQTRIALIAWAKKQWPSHTILNLNDIPVDNQAFKQEIEHLSQAIYASKPDSAWSGEALWQCIVAQKSTPTRRKKKNRIKLPPINPT